MEKLKLIVIYTYSPDAKILKEVLAGIEEEGLFAKTNREKAHVDAITLAYQAAAMSSTGVGIGIVEKTVKLAVKENLRPVVIDLEKCTARIIGQNAARYIKVKKLKVM